MDMLFSKQEYAGRIARVRGLMQERQLDLLLLYGQEAIFWTSGFYTPVHFAYAVVGIALDAEPFLIVRHLEDKTAQATTWLPTYQIFQDHEDPVAMTAAAVRRLGRDKARIGLDKGAWYLTAERYDSLKEALPQADFESDGHIVERLRFRKSPREIEYVRAAASAVEAGLHAAVEATKVGATERDAAAAMAFARLKAGSDLPVDGILTSGERIFEGHGPWTDRVFQAGDAVRYGFHGIRNNYWARLCRTGVIGPPTDRQAIVARTILDAQNAGLAMMKAGALSTDIDTAMREPLIEAELKPQQNFTGRLGYGIGLNFRPSAGEMIHDFSPGNRYRLEEGMVFHLLMVAEGMGFSDTVLVTGTGIDYITQFPRELLAL
jgi:Xaa-Pro dipeptidase